MQNFHQHNKIFAGNLYPAQKCGKIRLTKSKPVLFFYFEKENRIMILAIDIGKPDLTITFKHLTHAFLVFSFQESTAQAFANDRMIADGDVSSTISLQSFRALWCIS
jgi:hypothetical protein